MRDNQVWYNHSDYSVHDFKNNENNFRSRDKTKIFFGTRKKQRKNYFITISPVHYKFPNQQFRWPLKWSLRELQDNYLDLRLESTLSPVLDGGLEFLMCAASLKLKLKVSSEITHFTKSRRIESFFSEIELPVRMQTFSASLKGRCLHLILLSRHMYQHGFLTGDLLQNLALLYLVFLLPS